MLGEAFDRDLMGAEGAFHRQAVQFLGPGPSFGRAEHDHRPMAPPRKSMFPSILLNRANLGHHLIQSGRHRLVHRCGLVPFHEIRLIPVTSQQIRQFVFGDARQHRWPRDLVPVQVQNGDYRAIERRIQKLVGMPTGGQRAGLGFTIANDAAGKQVGIVENRAIGVQQRVPQFAALVDGTRRFRRRMAGNTTGKRKLTEQPVHAVGTQWDTGIQFAVRPLQPGVRHHAGSAVTGPADIDHVEVVLPDDAVAMHIDKIQTRSRSPMPEQPGLDVLEPQRLFQQRVVYQVNLPD